VASGRRGEKVPEENSKRACAAANGTHARKKREREGGEDGGEGERARGESKDRGEGSRRRKGRNGSH